MRKTIFLGLFFLAACSMLSFSASVFAAVKDSDHDGLTDESETTLYKTDSNVFDTDGDGVGDGDEVILGTNPRDVQDIPEVFNENVSTKAGVFSPGNPFSWYMARATGIVSFFLLTLVVVHGLIMSSRAFIQNYPAAIALEVHRFLSWAAIATVALHAGSFLFDLFLPMTVGEILIPFLLPSGARSVLGFDIRWTAAMGIVAAYLMLLLTLSSEFRSRLSVRVWRAIHSTSFAAYPLFLAHGILSGSDSRAPWAIALYGISGGVVSVLIITRIIFRNRAVRLAKARVA